MPDVLQLIKHVSRDKRVQPYIVEKDYAISYLLAAIASTNGLGNNIVLKGGTALRKLYFPGYRFSEDLDYSTCLPGTIEGLDDLTRSMVARLNLMMNERGPFRVHLEPLVLRQSHPGDQRAYVIHVQFPGQRQPLCRLKVEVTVDEPIVAPTENRPVIHEFAEPFAASVTAYSLAEITAEKLRALLQSRDRLRKRGWGASRVCRDYYDLWNLLRSPEISSPKLIALVDQKCKIRNVSYASPGDFISGDLLNVANSEWDQQLVPFVPNAPPAAELLPQVGSLILSIWK
jgi:predicted nucleotidyltransferase component of viral defense system